MADYLLSLDLSSRLGTLALHTTPETGSLEFVTETIVSAEGDHSEKLIPALHQALESARISMDHVGRLITTRGPGSFTGLRIGFATLKAFALSRNIPIITVHGSEARALAWRHKVRDAEWVSVLTQVASNRWLFTDFSFVPYYRLNEEKILEGNDIKTLPIRQDRMILTDEHPPPQILESNGKTEHFPLRARYLAETYLECSTRQEFMNLKDWIELSPNYFGEKGFKLSSDQ